MTRHIVLDWAFNVLSVEHLLDLKVNGHVEGCIIRTCEGWAIDDNLNGAITQQVANLRLVELPFGIYQYAHAGLNAARQVNYFKAHGLEHSPAFMAGDYECYINYFVSPVRFYTALELATGFNNHSDTLAASVSIPTINYSGPWVSEHSDYLPAIWLKRWFWGAWYLYDWDWKRPALWPQSWLEWNNRINALSFPVNSDYPTWGVWQFGGDIQPPGVNHRIDVNIIDNDDLFNWLFHGGVMPPLPGQVVTTDYRAKNLTGTFIQAGPGWGYAHIPGGYRFFNALVKVIESGDNPAWWPVYPYGWAAKNHVRKV